MAEPRREYRPWDFNDQVYLRRDLNITSRITLPETTSATAGVITKGGTRFIHTYNDPSSSIQVNTFVGKDAGNFTMGPNGGADYLGGYNTGIGFESLTLNTTGFNNTAVGENSLQANTTGAQNTAVGAGVMAFNEDGLDNVAIGTAALYINTTGDYNVAVGAFAGYINETVGNVSGRFNTYVGWSAGPASATQREGAIGIGYGVQVSADYTAVIGDSSVTDAYFGSMSAVANVIGKSVRGKAVTYANRPATPVEGMLVAITDSSTAVWGETITGGGANHVLGYYNGTNWTVAAK